MSAQRRLRNGRVALSETVVTVLLRTEKRLACSGSGTKNVVQLDRTDVVPGQNSTRNSSGTISTEQQSRISAQIC